MKQILLLALILGSFYYSLIAQNCTPKRDACTISQGGTVPACFSPENPPPAIKGQPYELDMSFVIGRTVKQSGLEVAIWRLEIIGIDGLPEGLTYTLNSGNPADAGTNSMTYPPDTKKEMTVGIYGCARIKGIPTKETSDTHNIKVKSNVYIKFTNQGEPTGNEIPVSTLVPGFNPAVFNYPLRVKAAASVEKQLTQILQYKIYPNPASYEATLSYELQEHLPTSVEVLDTQGKIIWKTDPQYQAPGKYSVALSSDKFPQGLYYVRLRIGDKQVTQKVMFLQ
ncbi:MAG: T9SS type A sorting domain-containing protein [Bacteroidia bacterium]|nr:T9SS type A sorting domain-containing protein [Bacteroidia bacterium]MDW8158620.1 T9SS type A sorting domain-containing protein [Bacteroidia bacterium]